MAWTNMTPDTWVETVATAVGHLDPPGGPSIARFQLVREPDVQASIHDGSLRVDGAFTPPAGLTAVFGDLHVAGRVSTEGVEDLDGNATLVVLGNLTCSSLVNDWASLVLVSGNITVRDWAFAAREDSSLLAGGDFETPLFIGEDIWVSVGGTARMQAGMGYAAPLDERGHEDMSRRIEPATDEATTARKLGLGEDSSEWVETLEGRLHETGTILPAA